MTKKFDQDDLRKAVETIRNGGIILFKDTTGWYYGLSSKSEKAVSDILLLQKKGQLFELLIENENKIGFFAENISDLVYDIFEINNNPTTIILPKKRNIDSRLISILNIGFRKTTNPLLSYLCNRINHPLLLLEISNIANSYQDLLNISNFDSKIADYIVKFNKNNQVPFVNKEVLRIEENGEVEIIKK